MAFEPSQKTVVFGTPIVRELPSLNYSFTARPILFRIHDQCTFVPGATISLGHFGRSLGFTGRPIRFSPLIGEIPSMINIEHVDMSLRLPQTLAALLKQKRISVRELSEATGVPKSTISEWQAGRQPKNPEHVRKVASYLEVSMHQLLFGEPDPHEAIDVTRILKDDLFSGVFQISVKRIKLPQGGGSGKNE